MKKVLGDFYLIIDRASEGAWNMAADEILMDMAISAEAPAVLRLYAWQPACLSLGQGQKLADVDLEAVQQNGWQVVRRPTGGKAILHTDELTYSLTAHEDHWLMKDGILASYQRISKVLLTFLHLLNIPGVSQTPDDPIPSHVAGPVCFEVPSSYEITVNGKKVVGSAQARRNRAVLQHGSIPLAGDIARITQALRFSDDAARQAAAHKVRQRAATLQDFLSAPPDWQTSVTVFLKAFTDTYPIFFTPFALSAEQNGAIEKLSGAKYNSPDWTARL